MSGTKSPSQNLFRDGSGPIRVCFVAPKAYPLFDPRVEEVFGGAEVDLYFLATELAKDPGFEVTMLVGNYGQDPEQTLEGVRVLRGLSFKQSALSTLVSLWKALRKADGQVYFIKTPSPGVPLLALFCKVRGRAFVYRTSSAPQYDRSFRKAHRLLGRAFDWALRRARVVLAQSQEAGAALKQDAGLTSVSVIPNGHRLGPVQDCPRDTILWVGRSDPMKRPELFIGLAARLPDQQFVMICQQATGDKDYPGLVECAKAVPNLQFVERVPFAQIDSWFRRAKVLVNTSDSEGFPNTFIQAAQAAVAIASLNSNPDNFLVQHRCGVFAQGSVDRLAEGLRSLLEGDRYLEAGRAARRYVEQTHDIRRIAETYKQVLRSLV
jgi:glycosyltransferase involved in cell wall biosynthesis